MKTNERKSKTNIAGTILCVAMLTLLCSMAAAQERYVVTATKLNVRKAASAEAAIVGGLSKGDQVDVYSFKGGWAEIGFKNGKAFVSKKYIEKLDDGSVSKPPRKTDLTPDEPKKKTQNQAKATRESSDRETFDFIGIVNVMASFTKHSTHLANSNEFGVVFPKTYGFLPFSFGSCLFATGGLGISVYSYNDSFSYMGYSVNNDVSNFSILIPLHAGIMLGDLNTFNGTVQAGVIPSFTVYASANNSTVHLPFGQRWGFAGSVRGSVGYKNYGLLVEFMFPFQAGTKGTLFLGVSYSVNNRKR